MIDIWTRPERPKPLSPRAEKHPSVSPRSLKRSNEDESAENDLASDTAAALKSTGGNKGEGDTQTEDLERIFGVCKSHWMAFVNATKFSPVYFFVVALVRPLPRNPRGLVSY